MIYKNQSDIAQTLAISRKSGQLAFLPNAHARIKFIGWPLYIMAARKEL
jgi:hypothetical protein